ncbi:hypothetical protein TetV_558 [Tetraselmis virus 1]|uniref:Uncharacterized protein n=1 Tax=Tetraselmis virus 1 TaxID=2060617 RepID=A0A2P0VP51_9VIRU|nr:hypothetical protein QJ968_gp496 [Tetraselmis virus 1]AUF82640.1 hypothetical protein TetV_558 [Tetraselmis virus 1]
MFVVHTPPIITLPPVFTHMKKPDIRNKFYFASKACIQSPDIQYDAQECKKAMDDLLAEIDHERAYEAIKWAVEQCNDGDVKPSDCRGGEM